MLVPFTKSTLIAALVASLLGCAIEMHHGTAVTEAQASSFTVGVATPDDVVKSLGNPSWSATRPNGEKVVGYGRSTSRINPPSFATLTGGSPRTEFLGMETTMFVFDTNSKLIRVERPPATQAPVVRK